MLFFFSFINKKKPDYWISNIFLALIAFYFFYNLVTKLGLLVNQNAKAFLTFKGIALLITILPAYLQILFLSLIAPFIKDWD